MTRRVNSNLAALLVAATDDESWALAFKAAMGNNRRIVCKRVANSAAAQDTIYNDGVTFRDVQLTGEMQITDGIISNFGLVSASNIATAADLLTGASILRFEGGGNWVEGTLGLTSEAQLALGVAPSAVKQYDFTLTVQPTATNGLALTQQFVLLRAGTPPPVEGEDGAPFRVVLEDWSTGSAGNTQTIYFDSPQAPIVWEDTQLAAQTGPIPYFQSTESFIHGTGGYCFELGVHLFKLPASCNDEVDAPVYQMLVAMTPKYRTSWEYPAMKGYLIAEDSTFIKPCKIYVYKRNGELWHTFEMQRDGLPLNDPSMAQTRNQTARWRPFINTAQMLYHCSHRLKESSDARKYYAGTVAKYWHRPKIGKGHGFSNASIPVFGSKHYQINGYLHFLAMPKWSCNSSTADWNADPKTDPNFPWGSANNPNGNSTDGSMYPTHAVGWGYEYGAYNAGHDPRHGPGGQRFDRFAIPSQLAYYMTDPNGARTQGNVPWRELWDNYAAGFFNHAHHHLKNSKTMEMIPVSEAGYGRWGYFQSYYNGSAAAPGDQSKWIRLHGLRPDADWRTTDQDRDGFRQWCGWCTDMLHGYHTPGWHTTHFNSVAHAISQKLKWFSTITAWNTIDSHPSANLGSTAAGANPQLFQRSHAWRWLQMAMVWKTASTHPLLVSRAQIEEIWRLNLESLYDNVVIPTTDPANPRYNHIFFQGLRRLGAPAYEIVTSTHHRYSLIDDDKKMYLIGVLTIMRTMGCFDRLRQINTKCAAALDWVVGCYGKYGAVRFVATKARQDNRYITQAATIDVPLTMPMDWYEVAANMQPNDGSDMVRQADGSQTVTATQRVRERWLYQHLLQQCVYALKDHFSDYNLPLVDEAVAMSDEFEEFVDSKVTGLNSYEYNNRFIAAGRILAVKD